MNPQVQVLLSTYNGARYLEEQLRSLAQQTLRPSILLRDDGSSDETRQIALRFAHQHPQLRIDLLPAGPRLGVIGSFFELIAKSDPHCQYFAFCDQDDVWQPGKLAQAVRTLEAIQEEGPRVYCSRLAYVDSELQHLGLSPLPRRAGFGNALVENIATGCSMLFDARAQKLLQRHKPRRALMHDWWLYLLASGLGTLAYDSAPQVLYRQHGANVVGGTASAWQDFARRVQRFLTRPKGSWHVADQAAEFALIYGHQLSDEKRELIEKFCSARTSLAKRLSFAFKPKNGLWRQSPLHTLILRLLILLGRF